MSYKILNVDDREESLYSRSRTLRRAGFTVLEAKTGADAIRIASQEHPQVILLDIHLPDLSGLDVCRWIKAELSTVSIQVIHVSATAVTHRLQAIGLESGADAYLVEPVEPEVLVGTIKSHIRQWQKQEDLRAALEELQKTKEALGESEERFRNIADTAPVMIWVAGPDNLGTFFNKAWLDFTGRALEQELGQGWISSVHPDDLDQCLAICGSSVAARRTFQIVFRLRRADGEYRWVLDNGRPRYNDTEFAGYIGSCIDVTDARRTQEESFSRQKLESLGTLASGIAHDFNNLLGAMLAQSELAMEELATGARPDQEIRAIRDVAIRGSEIVRQLMVYAGQESDIVEPVDVSSVIEGMLGLLTVTVSRHATLVTDLGENLPAVQARAAQLSQLVMNLVVNASEAIGDRDGIIRVTSARAAVSPAEADAKALTAGDYVRLEVSDSGRGMSPETQSKIFDPFFTTKFSGRGLGLAVAHGIVRGLHGTINVASELGKGTTFQVLLPCAEGVAKPGSGPGSLFEEPAQPAQMKASVLFVEDEEPLRLAVAKMLRRSGLEVFEADSGSAAIRFLHTRGSEIDLILLDLTLPGNSSQEVVAEATLARADTKVIVTSAYSEEVARPMISSPLVQGFIRKPFKLVDLLQILHNALSV